MRYLYFVLFIATITGSCTGSCSHVGRSRITGNGKIISEQRSLSDFTSIEVAGPYNVVLQQGADFSIRIEGDENLLKHIDTHVSGNALSIGSHKGYNLKSRKGIKVFINAPQINSLQIAGSGNINSSSKLTNTSKIHIRVGGSGDVVLDINAPEVGAEISGSGSVTLKGQTRDFKAEVAGSGEIHAFDLLSENTSVDIAGSGDVALFASKTLDISIAGSGDVRYKGSPAVKKSIAGSGDIRPVQ